MWGVTGHGQYLYCGQPAVARVRSPRGQEIDLCLEHADHYCANRGCMLLDTTDDDLRQRYWTIETGGFP